MSRNLLPGRRFAAMAAVAVMVAGAGFAAPPEGGDLCGRSLHSLARACRNFKALTADFRHTLKAVALNQNEVEEGTVTLAAGGKMRWEYTHPAGKLAVSDGTTSYLYLPGENRVYIQPMKRGPDAPLALRLLTGEVDLEREVTCRRAYRLGRDEVILSLDLVHRDPGVRDLEVAFSPEKGTLREILYKDALGNEVGLRLTNARKAGRLSPSFFEFTPPPGARVVRSR